MESEKDKESKANIIIAAVVILGFFLGWGYDKLTSTDDLEDAASAYQEYLNKYFDQNSKYPATLSEIAVKGHSVQVRYVPECDNTNVCKSYVLSVTKGSYSAIINSEDRSRYELFKNK